MIIRANKKDENRIFHSISIFQAFKYFLNFSLQQYPMNTLERLALNVFQ